jgi:hypothetical protein
MASNERKVRLEVESLENRLVPAFGVVQFTGGTLVIQGASNPELIRVFAKGNRLIVELTDLSVPGGITITEQFRRDRVRHVEVHEDEMNEDLFENEVHDRHIETRVFSGEGFLMFDDRGGDDHGPDDGPGHH